MVKDDLRVIADISGRGYVVVQYLPLGGLSPVDAYLRVVGDDNGFLLESLPGRYSFLGSFDEDGIITIGEGQDDPWAAIPLKDGMLAFSAEGLPPFVGGYVGYIGYDMVRGIEDLPRPGIPSGFPDAVLGKVNTVIAMDHDKAKLSIIHAITERGLSKTQVLKRASDEIRRVRDALKSKAASNNFEAATSPTEIESISLSDDEFMAAVGRAREYIRQGDIIQVVLSRRLALKTTSDPFSTYTSLRKINPSPYLFYIKLDDICLIGSSPEVMVKLLGDEITVLPIAGTRPRGNTPEEDEALSLELINDEKERAEHLMLLDLARNDVGRVSRPGTVSVPFNYTLKYYSHVMHIVSSVKGIKLENLPNVDVIKACFPAGTVTGAPKVRAMEIIDELEGMCRGPYAGAVGYISFNGNIDTGIAIRTIFLRSGHAYIQAGAGIVWDSRPEKELVETENKLEALRSALGGFA